MDTIPKGKYLKQISDLERKSSKAIITLQYILHEIIFLEVYGFQHDISAHGEMWEFHLKTCEQETAIGHGKFGSLYGSVCTLSIISFGAGTLLGSRSDMVVVIKNQLIHLVCVPN